jgi:hypothetical protein
MYASLLTNPSSVNDTAYIGIPIWTILEMNRVPLPRRVQVINCLVEGNSIRRTERMTRTHRDTICRLLVEVGEGCAKLMDEQMRELPCRTELIDAGPLQAAWSWPKQTS